MSKEIKLYDHQIRAIEKLNCGKILKGGVGSGKSLTSLAYYHKKINGGDYHDGNLKRPKKGKNNVPLYIITTAAKRDKKEWDKDCEDLGLEPRAIDSWNNIKKYKDVEKAFFIFDEQKVVGSGTWAKTFIKIAKKNRWILLTATPGDTWCDYIPVFVANGFYKNRTQFLSRHAVYSRFSKYPKIERFTEEGVLLNYRRAISVEMSDCRTTTRKITDVPVRYRLSDTNEVTNKRWNIFEDRPIETASELCYTLRKVANRDVSRLTALVELIEKNPKIIVFYNFNYELDLLRQLLNDVEVPYAEYNGHNHDPIPKTKRWVYLVQYTAGAEGWNCIETDTIVFYSLNYSYKVMEQAMGRIDRINTPFPVLYYYRFISKAPIDQAIEKALKGKKQFNELDYFTKKFKKNS